MRQRYVWLCVWFLLWWLCALLAGYVLALAGPITNQRGTFQTWLTLGSTANTNAVLGSIITPLSTGYQQTECLLDGTWSGTIAAQAGMALWVCTEINSVYEDCDATLLSARRPDAVFPLRAGAGGVQRVKQTILMPPGPLKALMQNVSGTTLTSGTLTCQPYTPGN